MRLRPNKRASWLALAFLLGCSRSGLDFDLSGTVSAAPDSAAPATHPDASRDFRPCSFSGPTLVASAGSDIDSIALDDASVYWTSFDDGQIYKAPKTGGGAVVDLASSGANPEGLAVSGGYAYWTDFNANTISRVPVGGGDVEVLASGQDGADSVVVDGDFVYWTNYRGGGSVARCPIGGGTTEILDQEEGPYVQIASDGPRVFWSSQGGTITSFDVATKATAVVAHPVTGGTIWSLATDGTNLYWSEVFSEDRVSIVEAPIGGGGASVMAFVAYDPSSCPGPGGGGCESGLATDGENLYVAVDGVGAVESVAVASASEETIASSGAWLGIGVDDACVYWSTVQGAIMGAPR